MGLNKFTGGSRAPWHGGPLQVTDATRESAPAPNVPRSRGRACGQGLALSFLLALPVSPLSAQDTIVFLSPSAACPACEIGVEHLISLRDHLGGRGAVSDPHSLLVTEDGKVFASYNRFVEVFVHDRDGRVTNRYGRRGEGPGEYGGLLLLRVGPGGMLHVFDRGNLRRTTLDPTSGEVVATTRIPAGPHDALVFRGDSVLVNAVVRTQESLGYPLHLVDAGGGVLRSFGLDRPVHRPDAMVLNWRRLVTSTDSTFWAAHTNRWRLEEWTLDGRMLRVLQYAEDPPHLPAWFQPVGTLSPDPPHPRLTGLEQDPYGRLWLLTLVPAATWASPLVERTGRTGPYCDILDRDRAWDTIVEVVDPESGHLLAKHRFDQALLGDFIAPVGAGAVHVLRTQEGTDGTPYVQVWRLSLTLAGR